MQYEFGGSLLKNYDLRIERFWRSVKFRWFWAPTHFFMALKSRSDGRITLTNRRMRESTFRGDARGENLGGFCKATTALEDAHKNVTEIRPRF